tara:strand:+ start:39 stop:2327 length:2289 start_codon:yes stop_codon:yes gene_type:complete
MGNYSSAEDMDLSFSRTVVTMVCPSCDEESEFLKAKAISSDWRCLSCLKVTCLHCGGNFPKVIPARHFQAEGKGGCPYTVSSERVEALLRELAGIESAEERSSSSRARSKTSKWKSKDVVVVEGSNNQYTSGGVSSCGIFAVEAALRIVYEKPVESSVDVDDTLLAAKGYDLENHPYLEDVLTHVERYQQGLTPVHFSQVLVPPFDAVTQLLKEHSDGIHATACILVRPPEVIMLAYRKNSEDPWSIFDSHSRELHHGAAFLHFRNELVLLQYLVRLFPCVDDEKTACSVHILSPSLSESGKLEWDNHSVTNFDSLCKRVLQSANIEQHQRILELSQSLLEETARNHTLQRELVELERARSEQYFNQYSQIDKQAAENDNLKEAIKALRNTIKELRAMRYAKPNQHGQKHIQENSPSRVKNYGDKGKFKREERGHHSDGNWKQPNRKHLSKQPQKGNIPKQKGRYQENGNGGSGRSESQREQVELEEMNRSSALHDHPTSEEKAEENDDEDQASLALIAFLITQDEKIAQDHNLARSMTQEAFHCPICMEDQPVDCVFNAGKCNDQICILCARDAVHASIIDSKIPVPCSGCSAKGDKTCFLDERKIRLVVDEYHWELYLRHSRDSVMQQTEGMYFCRAPDCQGGGILEEPDVEFVCPINPEHIYCTACDVDGGHRGKTCEEYRQMKSEAEVSDAFETGAGAHTYRPCPTCKTPIERTEGCHKITCRCGCLFCNRCGKKVNGYEHFNEEKEGKKICKLFDGQ